MAAEKVIIKTDFKDDLEKALEVLRENKRVFQQKGMLYEEILADSMIHELKDVMVMAKNLIDNVKKSQAQPDWSHDIEIQ